MTYFKMVIEDSSSLLAIGLVLLNYTSLSNEFEERLESRFLWN